MTNEELVKNIRAGQNEQIEALYLQNQGIICKVAKRFIGYEEPEDLKQEAFIILCEAVQSYDEDKAAFSTHFYKRLMWGFVRYIFKSRNALRISNRTLEDVNKYNHFVNDYKIATGREPGETETKFFLRMTDGRLERVKKAMETLSTVSLYAETGEGMTLADAIADPANNIEELEEELSNSQEAAELWGEVEKLPPLQCAFLKERFINQSTLSQIGESNGTTPEGARRTIDSAVKTLKRNKTVRRIARDRGLSHGFYQGGLNRFLATGLSSTEREAFRNIGALYEV